MLHTAYIGLGTNLGERIHNLNRALGLLPPQVEVLRLSSVWQTAPWGYEQQPDFLNQAAQTSTDLTPAELLAHLKHIEQVMGRQPGIPYGPRLIDLDILLYDDLVSDEPGLSIPHPHLAERAFVLQPLSEIAPDLIHPVLQLRISELAGRVSTDGVERYEGS